MVKEMKKHTLKQELKLQVDCELYGDAMVENISADDETFSIMIDIPFLV